MASSIEASTNVSRVTFEGTVKFRRIEASDIKNAKSLGRYIEKAKVEFLKVLDELIGWSEKGVPTAVIRHSAAVLIDKDFRSALVPEKEIQERLFKVRSRFAVRFSPLTGRCLIRRRMKHEDEDYTKDEVGSFGELKLFRSSLSAEVPDTYNVEGLVTFLTQGGVDIVVDGIQSPRPK